MLGQTANRARLASSQVARRGFSSSQIQRSSPFHYPEGPRSNIPFNPHTRFFAFRYWGFMGAPLSQRWGISQIADVSLTATGFGIPFALAGKMIPTTCGETRLTAAFSLANLQKLIRRSGAIWAWDRASSMGFERQLYILWEDQGVQ
jgi:cytochrome c oxidase subunit 7c